MNFFSKLIIIIFAVLSLIYIKDKIQSHNGNELNNTEKTQISSQEKENPIESKEPIILNPVTIYYTNKNSGELKKVIKEVPPTENKIVFAIKELINGPTNQERQQGFSTEIPNGTKILSIKDQGSIIVVDLSTEFQYGGGTESQYTRLNQLIKTVVDLKSTKPIYLYLNGEKAEVIGGEGIQITQPISESSLNEW